MLLVVDDSLLRLRRIGSIRPPDPSLELREPNRFYRFGLLIPRHLWLVVECAVVFEQRGWPIGSYAPKVPVHAFALPLLLGVGLAC